MLKRMMAIGAITLLVLATLAACGRELPEPPAGQVTKIPNVPGAPPQVYGTQPAAATTGGGAAGQSSQASSGGAASSASTSVTLEMVDIAFKPKEFTIPANTDVKLTLKNTGALPHDFSVTDHKNPNVKNLNISQTVQPGETKTITINAPAGNYYFFCNQPGHEAAGMDGTMRVVAGGGSSAAAASGAASPAGSPAAAASPAAASASGAAAASTSVTVDMEDIKFVPNEFTIPANTDVKVTLDNKGALPHDFSVTDHKNPNVKNLNISEVLQPGKSTTITINAPAGNYYYYCNQPGHEAAGMFGTMHVVAGGSASSGGSAAPAATKPAASSSGAAASGAPGVTVDMVDIAFKPNAFSIPANTPVKITLKNTGSLPHDFSIDKLHIMQEVDPGKTAEITINAPAGTYQYYCNQPGHKAAGMIGTLTVK